MFIGLFSNSYFKNNSNICQRYFCRKSWKATLTAAQIKMTRAAWSRLVAFVCISPLITNNTTSAELLKKAVHECFWDQPCGFLVIVATQSYNNKRRAWFVNDICGNVKPKQEVCQLNGG